MFVPHGGNLVSFCEPSAGSTYVRYKVYKGKPIGFAKVNYHDKCFLPRRLLNSHRY